MTTTCKLTLGDSNTGYDTALVTTTAAGKYRLVPDSINGRAWHIRRAIAALNRDCPSYITRSGDEKNVYLDTGTQ